jgi:hypothetical protein
VENGHCVDSRVRSNPVLMDSEDESDGAAAAASCRWTRIQTSQLSPTHAVALVDVLFKKVTR